MSTSEDHPLPSQPNLRTSGLREYCPRILLRTGKSYYRIIPLIIDVQLAWIYWPTELLLLKIKVPDTVDKISGKRTYHGQRELIASKLYASIGRTVMCRQGGSNSLACFSEQIQRSISGRAGRGTAKDAFEYRWKRLTGTFPCMPRC
jgi:hypothetical protein